MLNGPETGVGAEQENIIDAEEKAQLWANLIRRTALQNAAMEEFKKESPEDYERLALLHAGWSIGCDLSEGQVQETKELERKVLDLRAEIVSGERPVEPTARDYEAAEKKWSDVFDTKKGPVSNLVFSFLKGAAEKSATKELLKRSENLNNATE